MSMLPNILWLGTLPTKTYQAKHQNSENVWKTDMAHVKVVETENMLFLKMLEVKV